MICHRIIWNLYRNIPYLQHINTNKTKKVMKKLFFFFIYLGVSIYALAEKVEVNGLWFVLNEDKMTASFSSGDYSGEITVPESITYNDKKYDVTEVETFVFFHNNNITSVVFPNSIISMKQGVFDDCPNLTSVVLSKNLKGRIEQYTFMDCKSLKSIVIPDNVTHIDYMAFDGCESLTDVTFPKELVELGWFAFGGSGIKELNLYDKLETIGRDAFVKCLNLTTVKLPNSVKTIDEYAFNLCSNIKTIELPESVSLIEQYAFKGCTALQEFYCKSTKVPNTQTNAFEDSNINNATLYVPESSINDYKSKAPWKDFGKILSLTSTSIDKTEAPEVKIHNENGQLYIYGKDKLNIVIYNLSGVLINSAVINNGYAVINTNLHSGSVAIVKIDEIVTKIIIE